MNADRDQTPATPAMLTAIPRATVRLQFQPSFTFDDARAQLPYFADMGISHIYASPILKPRPGSTHGYDVVDHSQINPTLGGEAALRRLVAGLREFNMGLIVDIVPNHMAVGGDNAWWQDVLRWGRASRYAAYFDIDWDVPDAALTGRVLTPFLGRRYGEVLDAGEIELAFDAGNGRFFFAYFDQCYPLAPESYAVLLRASGQKLAALASTFREAVMRRRGRKARYAGFASACAALSEAAAEPVFAADMAGLLAQFSPVTAGSAQRLHRLLEHQHYRLAWWRTAPDEINWRRFFDVTDLAGLRVEDPSVFKAVHATTFRLYVAGLIDGLRVDHVDGLVDPRAYCRKLRSRLKQLDSQRPADAAPGPAYLIVEKILAANERLALDWRVDGTSGYTFMDKVGALLHAADGEAPLRRLWIEFSGSSGDFAEEVRQARRRISRYLLAADFNACAHALHVIARATPATRDWTLGAVRRVLAEMLVHFPVYRTYVDARGRSVEDAAIMAQVVTDAQQSCRPGERELVAQIDRWLGGESPNQTSGARARRLRLRAIGRFQQLTSPVAAKSVEDTAFYRYGSLLSRNEVGANPAQFSLTPEQFHHDCENLLRRYPATLLATATHDHKRGEDLRVRLAVLSEIPQRWRRTVLGWRDLNAPVLQRCGGVSGPDSTDQYMLYQMLVGAWPLELDPDNASGLASLCERLQQWQEKAVREAKRRSGWIEPNLAYEQACQSFLARLLDPMHSADFLSSLAVFVRSIAVAGAVNGLTQTLLRMTTPGVPDLYQGCELWDFSLVDPDNRRPVDFSLRTRLLNTAATDEDLIRHWRDGRIKQQLIRRTLEVRRQGAELFRSGAYIPVECAPDSNSKLLVYARKQHDRAILVAVPRCSAAALLDAPEPRFKTETWRDVAITLPATLRNHRWYDALGDDGYETNENRIELASIFKNWPVSLLSTWDIRSN